MFARTDRLNEVLKREVGQILLEELGFGRDVLITVSRVEVSSDLSIAKIYVSVLPDEFSGKVFSVLKKRVGHIQRIINKIVNIKKTPKLVFVEERGLKEAAKIEQALDQIKKGKAA
jgi:ribosome-binding factor A